MESRICENGGRFAHCRSSEDFDHGAGLQERVLLGQNAETFSLRLQKEGAAELLINHHSTNSHPVVRAFTRCKLQQRRKRHLSLRRLHFYQAEARYIEEDSAQLALASEQTAAYPFD